MSSPAGADQTPSEAAPAATPTPELTGPYIADAASRIETVAASAGRCRLLGEIARGGMGTVFKAHDPDLGRDLAVKVLLEQHRGQPELVRRFLEEARVGGRLQHPGVAPVHDVGRLADERPFFAMKLVEGRTLEQLLRQRESPAEDLPRFLKVFEQVCQTLAYAHAQGIIHRDLKPLNIMVGAFGEVQVMDWGLAKVMGTADGVMAGEGGAAPETTGAGQVMGTPSYMAPEQARGETDRLDARCDVFGLGAILCTILTGRPPYVGRDAREVLARAGRGELADACARLDACGADAELVDLAKSWLTAEPEERPAHAGLVAEATTGYLAGVQERLRQAELAKAAAQTKAAEERKRRRLTVVLAATILLAASGAGAGALWYQHDQSVRAAEHARRAADTERDVTAALDEGSALAKQAVAVKADPAKWAAALTEALSAVKRAEGVLNGGVDDTGRLQGRVASLRDVLEAANRDCSMVVALEAARFQEAAAGNESAFDKAGGAKLYAAAFRQDDKDWDSLGAEEAAARVNRRAIREQMLAALENWAMHTPNKAEAERIRGVVQAADSDPASFRNRWQALTAQRNLDGLRRLAAGAEAQNLPAASLALWGGQLSDAGGAAEAVQLMKAANDRRPGDFWIAFELAHAYLATRPPATEEAVRYYTAALTLRPDSAAAHNNLAGALHDMRRLDEAIAECRRSIELQSNVAEPHNNLGNMLKEKGRLDEAIAEHRKAIELNPDYAEAHDSLGTALDRKGLPDEAVAEYRKAIHLNPDYSEAHNDLGEALGRKGLLDEAVAEYRKAIELKPDYAEAHNNLAGALRGLGRLDEAVVHCRRATELKPDRAEPHNNLGNLLQDMGRLEDAIAEHRKAIELKPDYADAHNSLGMALSRKGRADEAVAEYRKAIELKPDYADAHYNLGAALSGAGRTDDAIAEYRRAIDLKPDLAEAHDSLGAAVAAKGGPGDAIAEFRKAIELKPDLASAHYHVGVALDQQGRRDEAIREFRKAFELRPDYAEAHYACGNTLDARGRPIDAMVEYHMAIDLNPHYAEAHYNLGNALRGRGSLDDTVEEYCKAIELKPDLAEAWCNLGNVLQNQGRFADALAVYRRGHELGSKNPGWVYPSAAWVRYAENLVRLDATLPTLLQGAAEPSSPAAGLAFAQVCRYKRLNAAAARFYGNAFAAEPALAANPAYGTRYSAAGAAALAGCGQGEDAAAADAKERAHWRMQARNWLLADLAAWTSMVANGTPQERVAPALALQYWKQDRDLAGIRDADALAKLPPDEQAAWRQFWADVDAQLAKAQSK